ncbi:MAG: 4Fe-4S binding protein [Candidatus Desulforudis sp.]|nr:4Fe-4S binding protein [Desulforudis sp.]
MPWMVGNILKNLGSRPATRPYPVVFREPYRGARGKIEFQAHNCVFCGECERQCPTGAIFLDTRWEQPDASEPTWYRVFDPCGCILCGVCIEACVYEALNLGDRHESPATQKELDFNRVESW